MYLQSDICYTVPQGSILGPLLQNDICYAVFPRVQYLVHCYISSTCMLTISQKHVTVKHYFADETTMLLSHLYMQTWFINANCYMKELCT